MCCSTTPKTKAASPAVKDASAVKKPPALPPIQSLQKFLNDAYNANKANLEPSSTNLNGYTLTSTEAAISIRLIESDGNQQYAGINDTKMYYSGSLVKVAAIYAAFDLRAAARQHAATTSFSSDSAFFTSLNTAIDTSTATPRLIAFGQGLQPEWSKIFKGHKPTGTDQVSFTDTFRADLIKIGENPNAAKVIRALGYSYINTSLKKGNFFDEPSLNGIWLAGDYTGEGALIAGGIKSVRVPVVNDNVPGGGAQAITTKKMSEMFYMLHTEKAYQHVSNASERALANTGPHWILQSEGSFFFDPRSTPFIRITEPRNFTKHCAKVGIGTLGPIGGGGPNVMSEAAAFTWTDTVAITAFNTKYSRKLTGDFTICWQNMYKPDSRFDVLVRLVNKTIKDFLAQ
jgi:hypothetical protein